MARTKKDVTVKHRVKRVIDSLRLLRGFDRAAHFAAGGTTADWRGKSDIRTDKRKEACRQACRRRVDNEA
jgi:hypothetical protein